MNFLAHFHLAWPDEGLVAGGLEGDYYKGPVGNDLPETVARGVRLHRAIDAYTDQHPCIRELKAEFHGDIRRCAGILIDLAFDHYLSSHWSQFSPQPLGEFIPGVYEVLRRHENALSEDSRTMLARMIEYDILALYSDWEAVPASAERIGRRFRNGNPLCGIENQLMLVRESLERAFLEFYPELQAFCRQWHEP